MSFLKWFFLKKQPKEIEQPVSNIQLDLKNEPENLRDIDGNVYKTIKIGNQIWMAENLNVSRFINGDSLATNSPEEWVQAGENQRSACCYYANNPENGKIYGRLYNWFALVDPRGIAPKGWHVPTDVEWKELEMFLGMSRSEADKVVSRDTDEGSKIAGNASLWFFPGLEESSLKENPVFGTSGFSALPGGYCIFDTGNCYSLHELTRIWSATEDDDQDAWARFISCWTSSIDRRHSNKRFGYSIRLVKD